MTEKVKKRVNVPVSTGTAEKMVLITKARKKLNRLDWSQQNIIKGLVDAAHKKEVENAKSN